MARRVSRAATPVKDALRFAERARASLVCLSASREQTAAALATALRKVDEGTLASIVIGGAGTDARLARTLGVAYAGGETKASVESLRAWAQGMSGLVRGAAAGALAATTWALVEPLDRRLFRFGYSDVALLGKAVTRGPLWRPVGLAVHAANGAGAGMLFSEVDRRVGGGTMRNAVTFAMVEHVVTYPLTMLTDRLHPARGAPELPPMSRSGRAFAQATFRHLLFGVVLGLLARRTPPR